MRWVLLFCRRRSTERLNYSCQVRQSTCNRSSDSCLIARPQSPSFTKETQRAGEHGLAGETGEQAGSLRVGLPAPSHGDGDSLDTCHMTSRDHMGSKLSPDCEEASRLPDRCDRSPSLGWLGPQRRPLCVCAGTSELRGEVTEPTLGFTRTHYGSLFSGN